MVAERIRQGVVECALIPAAKREQLTVQRRWRRISLNRFEFRQSVPRSRSATLWPSVPACTIAHRHHCNFAIGLARRGLSRQTSWPARRLSSASARIPPNRDEPLTASGDVGTSQDRIRMNEPPRRRCPAPEHQRRPFFITRAHGAPPTRRQSAAVERTGSPRRDEIACRPRQGTSPRRRADGRQQRGSPVVAGIRAVANWHDRQRGTAAVDFA